MDDIFLDINKKEFTKAMNGNPNNTNDYFNIGLDIYKSNVNDYDFFEIMSDEEKYKKIMLLGYIYKTLQFMDKNNIIKKFKLLRKLSLQEYLYTLSIFVIDNIYGKKENNKEIDNFIDTIIEQYFSDFR
jgi:hypothetical protein